MTREQLVAQIREKRSFLCIGLDPDPSKLPDSVKDFENPVTEFNRQIIEATQDLCVAYKPNTAFFEAEGAKGWTSLEDTIKMIPDNIFCIADAKRGDIGNTAEQYAKAFFDNMGADAITLSPYMGKDAIQPFLNRKEKWAIVLAVTSNPGALDFQFLQTDINGLKVYQKVVKRTARWGTPDNLMFVTGATQPELLGDVREMVPDHFLLVPGVGAQGGSLEEVCRYGMTKECGLLVNSSRGIIFASSGPDFAEKARQEALKLQKQMEEMLIKYEVIR